MRLNLISHTLCPYVQRAAIALAEKDMTFERTYVDLANKPDWFKKISPLGKTPVLKVDDTPVFESSAILEYLEDTLDPPLHPRDPLDRARHRSWIEFGSAVLNDIGGFYSAGDKFDFAQKTSDLSMKFIRLEEELAEGPYFDGLKFSLVDAVFGPVFRYFDVFDQIGDCGILQERSKVNAWREALSERPSIRNAVTPDYNELLFKFIARRQSFLSTL
jgi:glutathione S-transferase